MAEEEFGEVKAIAEEDVEYVCLSCGTRVRSKMLEARGGFVRCPNANCRSRILRKVRPLGVKHIRCE